MKWIISLFYNVCTVCKPNQSKTVRYAFPLVFATMAFLGAQALTSGASSYILVQPSTNTLKAGETFYLDVIVNARTAINAVDLEVAFPRDKMKITGIDTGESVITLWTEEPYVKNNVAYIRGGTFRRGFLGEHHIVTINAVAIETGIAEIKVSDFLLLAGDGSGTIIEVSDTDKQTAKVYVADEDGNFAPGTVPSQLAGRIEILIDTDIDGDGEVSLADVSRFMSSWFTKDRIFDFNNDGQMTFRDFGIILSDSFFK